jgi:hypothetical protein
MPVTVLPAPQAAAEEEDARRRETNAERLMEQARKDMREADELAKKYWAVSWWGAWCGGGDVGCQDAQGTEGPPT